MNAPHPKSHVGRPRTGFDGARMTDYRLIGTPVPEATHATLRRISEATGEPKWRLVVRAVELLAAVNLPPRAA